MSRNDDGHGVHEYGAGDDGMNGSDTPVDLAAVQADEALLNMLGGGQQVPGDTDAELTRVLVAWRRDVESEPFGDLVDPDSAAAAIGTARRASRRRHPMLGPVAAAAAVLVIAFSAVGLVAKSAQPGDQLWGVTKVLYSDYARSVEAAKTVSTELNTADTALKQGRTLEAKQSLERAQKQLAEIAEAEGHTQLVTQHRHLEEMLQEKGPEHAGSSSSSDPFTTSTVAPEPAAPPPAILGTPVSPSGEPQPEPGGQTDQQPSTAPTTSAPSNDLAPGSSEPSPRSAPPPDEPTTQAPPEAPASPGG
jgi:hypothetical protein